MSSLCGGTPNREKSVARLPAVWKRLLDVSLVRPWWSFWRYPLSAQSTVSFVAVAEMARVAGLEPPAIEVRATKIGGWAMMAGGKSLFVHGTRAGTEAQIAARAPLDFNGATPRGLSPS
jgi:hypothetical protein